MVKNIITICFILQALLVCAQKNWSEWDLEKGERQLDARQVEKLKKPEEVLSLHAVSLRINSSTKEWERMSSISESYYWLTNLERFDCRAYKLGETDFKFSEFNKLRFLSMASDSLIAIPEDLKYCISLEKIQFRSERFTQLPAWLFELPLVETLHLSKSAATVAMKLPNSVKQNTMLKQLTISEMNLRNISNGFLNFLSLEKLDLSGNPIKTIPPTIGLLKKLTELNLSNTSLESLPEELQYLATLKYLNLKGTKMSSIPDWVFELPALEELGLPNGEEIVDWFEENHEKVIDLQEKKPNLKIY